MFKIVKTLFFLIIFLLLIANFSFATDINMNLQDNNSISNTLNQQEDLNSNIINSNSSATITSSSSVSDDSLGLTNVLNILLIVVGVVLILLGIAILIRMH